MVPQSLLALPPYATTSPSRLQALYSDFSRQKHSNPTSYHANIEWWRKALQLFVSSGLQRESGSRFVLEAGRSLIEQFRLDRVGKPLAFGAVVTELRANNCIIPRSEFLTAKDSIYNPAWLPSRIAAFVIGKPLWWSLEQLGIVGDEGLFGNSSSDRQKDTGWWGDYVVVSLLERAADEVLQIQREKVGRASDKLYTFEGFRKVFGSVLAMGPTLTEEDTKILLKFLERDRKAIVFDTKVIKFIVDEISTPHEINPVDRGILELKSAVENLQAQVNGLQHNIDERTQKASAALHQKHKAVALSYLRSRKQLEALLTKRLGSLNTLESTFIRVEAAADDIEIMKSYESSTMTLRAILAHPSLQRESIETTMDALAEVNADAKEVDEAVRIGADIAIGVSDTIYDGDLEEELRGLVEEAEREKVAAGTEREIAAINARLERIQVPSELPEVVEEAKVQVGISAS